MEIIKQVLCTKQGRWKNRRRRYQRDLVPVERLPKAGLSYNVISESRMYSGRDGHGRSVFESYYLLEGYPGCVAFNARHFKEIK